MGDLVENCRKRVIVMDYELLRAENPSYPETCAAK